MLGDPGAGAGLVTVGARYLTMDEAMKNVAALGLSPRQQHLNMLWSWYKTVQYEGRKFDWDGDESQTPLAREAISREGYNRSTSGPGIGKDFPLKYRRPTVQYHLVKVVVNRFSGMLFSERRHPNVRVEADLDTDDYLNELFRQGHLWAQLIQARQFGGAMGTTAIGFKFVRGKPVFEVHDPRWLTPLEWVDRDDFELGAVEKKYIYPESVRNPQTGRWEQVATWYRRVISTKEDILFEPCRVVEGVEPQWKVAEAVKHNFDFCPVQWIQNIPVDGDIDGECDVEGLHELSACIDALLSQSNAGTIANCDPTLLLKTKGAINDALKKGSRHALKTEPEGNASYLEMAGTGLKMARELAQELRTLFLEVAQCVLDHPDTANRTATEVERAYSSMISKTDVMREQYGERGIKPLGTKVLRAVRHVTTARIVVPASATGLKPIGDRSEQWKAAAAAGAAAAPPPGDDDRAAKWAAAAGGAGAAAAPAGDAAERWAAAAAGTQAAPVSPEAPEGTGPLAPDLAESAPDGDPASEPRIEKAEILLPPKVVKDENGQIVSVTPRMLGPNPAYDFLSLQWPAYFQPTLADAQAATTAATAAAGGKLISDEAATNFLAPFFSIEDPQAMLRQLREKGAMEEAKMMEQMQLQGAPPPPGVPGAPLPPGVEPGGEPPPGEGGF